MPGQITVTFKGFTEQNLALNLPAATKAILPKRTAPGPFEGPLIKTGLEAAAALSPSRSPVIKWLLDLMATPPAAIAIAGAVPIIPIRRSKDFTLAVGVVASAGAALSGNLGGGFYYWNKPPDGELGLFGSLSIGYISNIGASLGDSFAYLFDKAPAVLAGDILALGVDVEVPPVTLGGQLYLTMPPVSVWPPTLTGPWIPEIVGVGFTISAGVSVLPVNIAVTPSRTWIKPLWP